MAHQRDSAAERGYRTIQFSSRPSAHIQARREIHEDLDDMPANISAPAEESAELFLRLSLLERK
jgi:hypothetical protein